MASEKMTSLTSLTSLELNEMHRRRYMARERRSERIITAVSILMGLMFFAASVLILRIDVLYALGVK